MDEQAIRKIRHLLDSPKEVSVMAEKNYRLAQEHFSMDALQRKLAEILLNY